MTSPIVVDASVAVKWVVPEVLSDHADALLHDSAQRQAPLVAPHIVVTEVTNTLWQKVRRGDLSQSQAAAGLQRFLAISVELRDPPQLHQRALVFTAANGLPAVYDAVYVVLAEMLAADLWTDDRALLRAVALTAPWVRWIGDHCVL